MMNRRQGELLLCASAFVCIGGGCENPPEGAAPPILPDAATIQVCVSNQVEDHEYEGRVVCDFTPESVSDVISITAGADGAAYVLCPCTRQLSNGTVLSLFRVRLINSSIFDFFTQGTQSLPDASLLREDGAVLGSAAEVACGQQIQFAVTGPGGGAVLTSTTALQTELPANSVFTEDEE